MSVVERDLAKARVLLSNWLAAKNPAASDIKLSDLTVPSIGFSGEILLFDASWNANGEAFERGMAVRIEPSSYQVFLDTNFEEQYRVQEALMVTDLPIAPVIAFESDESILGARFFVTEKIPGRAYDVQTNPESWILSLTHAQQERLYCNFLDVMASLHRLDPEKLGLEILDQRHRGATPFDQQLQYYHEYYEWGAQGQRRPVIEAGFEWIEDNKPSAMPPTGIVWGDARMGNQLWDEQQRCTAILDWEMCTLGPAEEDFAWFLFQDHARPQTAASDQRVSWAGSVVPPGVLSTEATIAYYEKALGRPLENLAYYSMWAELRTAVIVTRLTPLLNDLGIPPLANVGEEAVAERLGMAI